MAVKIASLALVSIYSFEIIYVLVRTLPPGLYPWMVLLSSFGGYVIATDLGFSVYVYAVVRRRFLMQEMEGAQDLVSEAAGFYVLIVVAASALAAVVIALVALPGLKLALSLYFMTIILPLPWMLIRRVAAALDLYMAMETLECGRRAAACALAATMLAGVRLAGFALANLVLWGVSMSVAWAMLKRRGFALHPVPLRRLIGFVGRNKDGIVKSGRFTILEFLIFNYPYLAIPLIFHGPANLVAFDVFSKVTRFGSSSYTVSSEVFTPAQTRCFYAGDRDGVLLYQRCIWASDLVPFLSASALLILAGGPVFAHLLAGAGSVAPPIRFAMIGMLGALLVQTASGGFLITVSRYRDISRAALISAILMALLVAWAAAAGLSFPAFMLAYVAIFAIHAALCQRAFAKTVALVPSAPSSLQPRFAVPAAGL